MASEAWAEVGSPCEGITPGRRVSTASHFATASIVHSAVVSCSPVGSCDFVDIAFAYLSDPCSSRIHGHTRRGLLCLHSSFPV